MAVVIDLDDFESVFVTQTRSSTGCKPKTRGTLRALGLRRVGATRRHVVTPSFAGMVRRVEPFIQIRPALGVLRHAAPPLEAEFIGEYHGDQLAGEIAQVAIGELFRVERRPDSLVIGWTPRSSARNCLGVIHKLGNTDCVFRVSKDGRSWIQDPWQPGIPNVLRESPTKVQFARLDFDEETVVWERSHPSALPEIVALVAPEGWPALEKLLERTSSPAMRDDILKRIG